MTTTQVIDANEFNEMTMNALVAWFNANCREIERLKSFRTKAIGVSRCKSLLEHIEEERKFQEETADMTDEEFARYAIGQIQESAEKENPELAESVRASIEESTMKQDVHLRSVSLASINRVIKKDSEILRHNGEGVRESWRDPEVHAKRTLRNRIWVEYGGKKEEFRSVREAFEHLGLPMKSHIRFRGKLKNDGERTFSFEGEDYIFEVIQRNK